jgi:hypothetical protein
MSQQVLGILSDVISSDNLQRRRAEIVAEELSRNPSFFRTLVNAVADESSLDLHQRFAAASLLKMYEDQSSTSSLVELSRDLVNTLMRERETIVANMLASAIARMIHHVHRETGESSDAIRLIRQLLVSEDPLSRRNALRLADEVLHVQHRSLREPLAALCEPLIQISGYDPVTEWRCVALGIISDLIEMLDARAIKPHIVPYVGLFYAAGLRAPDGSPDGDEYTLHAGKVAFQWMLVSPNLDVDSISALLLALSRDLPIHEDEDPESFAVKIATQRLDFLSSVLRKKKFSAAVIRAVTREQYSLVLAMLVENCLLSNVMEAQWTEVPSLFLQGERERRGEMSFERRDIAADCAQQFCSRLGAEFTSAALDYLLHCLMGSLPKQREAVLFLLCHLLDRQFPLIAQAKAFCVQSIVSNILENDFLPHVCTVVRCRSLMLLRALIKQLRKRDHAVAFELSAMLMAPTVATLLNSPTNLLLCSSAVSLLSSVAPMCTPDHSTSASGLHGLLEFISQPRVDADLLYVSLETLSCWIKKCSSDTPGVGQVPDALFDCWRRNVRDPNVGELVEMVFSAVIPFSSCEDALRQRIPWIADVLAGQASVVELCAAPHLIKIVALVIQRGGSSLAQCVLSLLSPLCRLLITSEDTSVIGASADCLSALLGRAEALDGIHVTLSSTIMESHFAGLTAVAPRLTEAYVSVERPVSPIASLDGDDVSVPVHDALVVIAEVLLGERRGEIGLLSSGRLLLSIAERSPLFSVEHINRFIGAITARIPKLRTDSAVQELVQPLAFLLLHYSKEFLSVVMRQTRWSLRFHAGCRLFQRSLGATQYFCVRRPFLEHSKIGRGSLIRLWWNSSKRKGGKKKFRSPWRCSSLLVMCFLLYLPILHTTRRAKEAMVVTAMVMINARNVTANPRLTPAKLPSIMVGAVVVAS